MGRRGGVTVRGGWVGVRFVRGPGGSAGRMRLIDTGEREVVMIAIKEMKWG